MQLSTTFGLLAAAFGLVQADFVADFYATFDLCDNEDDPGKSTTFTENCLAVNNDYETLKLSTDDGTTLEQCGPFFTDSDCTTEVTGSDTFTCSNCESYTNNVYVYVA